MTTGLQAVTWRGHAKVEKFWADDDLTRATPHEVIEAENLLLTAGANYVLGRLTSDSAAKLNASTGYICVGDGVTAVSAGQTDLQGTNKYRQILDGAPTVSGNVLQAVATFTTAVANFHWQEFGLANSASGAILINRAIQDFGTKTSSLQWVLTASVTLS